MKFLNEHVPEHSRAWSSLDSTSVQGSRQRVLKFRLSNHRLPIQHRRSLGIPRDERICTICNGGEVGDEFHYLLNCSSENAK